MCGDVLRSGYWREGLYSLFMRRNSCAAPLRQFALPLSLKLGGTSFNTQNPIPHKSQKTKGFLETSRAKEFQRGTAQAEERAKEGGKVPVEGSDTHLGEVPTHIWEHEAGRSNRPARTQILQNWIICGMILCFILEISEINSRAYHNSMEA